MSALGFTQHCSSAGGVLPHVDHVWITTESSVPFHKNEFDEIHSQLYSTESSRSFEKYPTLPSISPSRGCVLFTKADF